MPSWLRVRGEFRERIEGFSNANYTEGRDDAYALTRFRFNVAVTAAKHLAFQANLQDARVADKEVGPTTAPFRGPFDLRTAFADVGDAKVPVALRLGRQEIAFGEQRLIGSLPWVNTGRSWDAARVILRSSMFQVDVFGASLVRSLPDDFDKSGNGNRLAGAYATSTKLVPRATVEPYVFWRRDVNLLSELGVPGTLSQTTIGTRIAGQLPARLDYGVEMAMQRGGLDAGLHQRVGRTLAAACITARVGSAEAHLRIQLRDRRRERDRRRRGRPSISSIPRVTTSSGCPIRSAGATSITFARASRSHRSRRRPSLSTITRGGWRVGPTAFMRQAALSSRELPDGAVNTHVGQEIDFQVSRAITPQLQLSRRLRAHLQRRLPARSHSRRVLQPSLRYGHVRLSGGEIDEHTTSV